MDKSPNPMSIFVLIVDIFYKYFLRISNKW